MERVAKETLERALFYWKQLKDSQPISHALLAGLPKRYRIKTAILLKIVERPNDYASGHNVTP